MKRTLLFFLLIISSFAYAQQDSVNLTTFTGLAVEQGVDITWITNGEYNVQHYRLQRSLDAITFEDVCQLLPQNSSNTEKHYHYADEGVYRATVYYRLQTQMNSTSTYSNIIAVTRSNMEELPDIQFFPTITESIVNIVKNTEDDLQDAQVRVFNMSGHLVHAQTITGDFIKLQLDVTDYERGTYIIELSQGKFAAKSKFIKQ